MEPRKTETSQDPAAIKKKYQEFTEANIAQIKDLLDKHTEDPLPLIEEIEKFLDSARNQEAASFQIPEGMDLGLLSLILNNMSLYLGNSSIADQP